MNDRPDVTFNYARDMKDMISRLDKTNNGSFMFCNKEKRVYAKIDDNHLVKIILPAEEEE